jgi:hypothetical protein
MQAAIEDRLGKIVKGGPYNVHMCLLALPDVTIRAVDRLQVSGEIDTQ